MTVETTPYTRAPERLRALQPSSISGPDVFGVEDRLRAIRDVLDTRAPFATAVDLGGHSGFFSLSLGDLGLVDRSTVYDLDPRALAAGRSMASTMGLSDRIQYVEQAIDLRFMRSVAPADLVICLNLIHHAGARFDVEDVKRRGWEAYATDCLANFKAKCRVAIVGLGFKGQRPLYWDVAKTGRPRRFWEVATRAGWSVVYDANVEDIQTLGVTDANGRRTRRHPTLLRLQSVAEKISRKLRGRPASRSKAHNYHLFILE